MFVQSLPLIISYEYTRTISQDKNSIGLLAPRRPEKPQSVNVVVYTDSSVSNQLTRQQKSDGQN